MPKRVYIDFETEAIAGRPDHPPKPVGLAVTLPGKPKRYYAWGHPTQNGIWELHGSKVVKRDGDPRTAGVSALKDAYKCDEIGGQNIAKFDLDVAETHLKVKAPPWYKVRDALFSRFLADPHAPTLALKPSAERVLGIAPDQRDAVCDWLYQKGVIAEPKTKDGKLVYPKNAGDFISKAPGDLVGLYAIQDNTLADAIARHDEKILHACGMWEAYERELQVAPILLANERQGMRVDVARLEADHKIYGKALVKVEDWLRKRLDAKVGINWDSDEEVADALEKSGVVKQFPLTETGKRSVSKTNLTKRFFTDPLVYDALVYRNTVVYVLTQNIEPWLATATKTGGWIYTVWNQVRSDREAGGGARSGRITCSKWQNIIKNPTSGMNPDYLTADDERVRKKIGLPPLPLARKYCLPDEGDLFVHRDWNQQELRLLAHYEEGRLAEAYRKDPATDIHGMVQKWMVEIGRKHYEREPVKRADFLTAYGGGAPALSRRTHMTLDEARAFLAVWRKALPDVVTLNKRLMAMYMRGDPIRTFGGRLYFCKPPSVAKKGDRKGQMVTFEYTALNYLLQPSGADLIKMAIIGYDQHPKRRGRLLSCVHDELNASAPKKLAKAENAILQEVMEGIKLDVPWKSDGDERPNWGEKK